LKKIVLIATALICLVAAGAAYAAINTYTATIKVTSKQHGTRARPVPIGYTQDINAQGTDGFRTALLSNIKTTIYGAQANGKDFPVCTEKQISAAHSDARCPKKAEVATGYITATVAPAAPFTAAGSQPNCNPLLDVWNGGQGKLTFFFVDQGTHQCVNGALRTGDVPPYVGTYREVGNNLVVNVPVPSYVSKPIPGLTGSLDSEHLVWLKRTTRLKDGKVVAAISSFACLKKARPYATALTAARPGGANETDTVTHKAPCS
jgi:hypothetical protein